MIVVTLFDNVSASTKRQHDVSVDQLADIIENARAPEKSRLPLLKLAEFGDQRTPQGSLRHNENVIAITGVEGDYDAGRISIDDAAENLRAAGVQAILYTSARHTSAAPRWRAICPFSASLPPEDRDHMMSRLNGALGGVLSTESWTLSQSYFYGGVKADYRVLRINGEPIDLADRLDAICIGKPAQAQKGNGRAHANGSGHADTLAPIALENLSEWVRELIVESKSDGRKVKQRGPQCWAVCRYLNRTGYTEQQVTDLAARHPKGVFGKYDGRLDTEIGRIWAKLGAPVQSGLPVIAIDPGANEANAKAGLDAVRDAGIYQRAGKLVQVVPVRGKAWDGEPVVIPVMVEVSRELLAGRMSDAAYWTKENKDGDPVRVTAPKSVVEMAQCLPAAWSFPVLRGVIGTPTLRQDGSLLTAAGYDEMTGYVLYDPPALPPIPNRPTKIDAQTALGVLRELLAEFPFADQASRSAALSGIMSPVLRSAVDVVPLHAIDAPAAGTGKSYLVDICAMIAYGDRAAVLGQSRNEDETEKRLIGAALQGQPIIPIDNCSHPLTGDFLCQVTERPIMQLRALGGSGLAKVDNTFVVFATGNNLEISADQVRRTIRTRMDANVENPEQRRFDRSPLNEARKDRGKYIAAVLTIARAYFCAGCPDLKLYPSYEAWSRLVRSPLMWLGEADPLETVEGIRTEDTKHAARAAVFWAWPADGQEYTTPALIETATQNTEPALRDALLAVARGGEQEISPVRLGKWLAKQAAVVSSGRKLIRGQTARGFVTWKMVGNGPF